MTEPKCDWCESVDVVTHLDGDNLCHGCANKWVRGEGIAAQEAVDQERREAEREAQRNMTDATFELAPTEAIQ